jgi:hypothetical protein
MGSDATLAALKAAHERRQARPVPVGCIAPGCGRGAHRRGLCPAHYRQAALRVEAGVAWATLIEGGEALPSRNAKLKARRR